MLSLAVFLLFTSRKLLEIFHYLIKIQCMAVIKNYDYGIQLK